MTMRSMGTAQVLSVWERGAVQAPTTGAMLLLAAAYPEVPEPLSDLPVGRRDALLLTLRERLFGPRIESVVSCPRCQEQTELAFAVDDIRAEGPGGDCEEPLTMNVGEYRVQFRLPTVADIDALGDNPQVDRRVLLERCLLAACRSGETQTSEQLPDSVVDAIAGRMAEYDPQADVQVSLVCPACGHTWQAVFDIVSFLWQETTTWAYRILQEVHQLAVSYGWSERDILAMSPLRRQMYLSMLSGA